MSHHHTQPKHFSHPGGQSQFVALVGKPDSESEIHGRSGEHYKIIVDGGDSGTHEVDVNIQSSDGSDIMVYIGHEDGVDGDPEGLDTEARLSYAQIGLTDAAFNPISDTRLESLLQTDIDEAAYLAVYGTTYSDGGPAGVHLVHRNESGDARDGAVAFFYSADGGKYTVRWYFFKFNNQSVG